MELHVRVKIFKLGVINIKSFLLETYITFRPKPFDLNAVSSKSHFAYISVYLKAILRNDYSL